MACRFWVVPPILVAVQINCQRGLDFFKGNTGYVFQSRLTGAEGACGLLGSSSFRPACLPGSSPLAAPASITSILTTVTVPKAISLQKLTKSAVQ